MGMSNLSGPLVCPGGFIGPMMGGLFTGTYYFVDPANGLDGNDGLSPQSAVKTIYAAYKKCVAGNDDVVVLMSSTTSSSSTAGTARLSKANALLSDSSATTGTLTWAKNSTHLIGATAPTMAQMRARIAAETTDTLTGFGSGNFVVVTAQGCCFANFSVFQGFATGGASEIGWTDSGGRNYYENVALVGGGDTDARALTSFRSLKISGSTGENTFRRCIIGLDTLKGTGATREIEFAGGSPRNVFDQCIINTYAGATTAAWVTVGTDGIDRYALFRDCFFQNPVLPADAAAASELANGIIMPASPGGLVHVQGGMYYGAARLSAASGFVFVNAATAVKDGLLAVASAT